MVRRGLAAFADAVYQLENLRLACAAEDAAAVCECGWRVVTIAVECLALVNQVTFDRAWARDLAELDRFGARLAGLQTAIQTITTATDAGTVLAAAERLVDGTRVILR
ncbi:MAG: hypothetical protein QF664_11695 [Dehalococcoidia bacterium]|jgi:hypothetical protein|nr:hypothetical protein [Dehalococcoidia bacterium]